MEDHDNNDDDGDKDHDDDGDEDHDYDDDGDEDYDDDDDNDRDDDDYNDDDGRPSFALRHIKLRTFLAQILNWLFVFVVCIIHAVFVSPLLFVCCRCLLTQTVLKKNHFSKLNYCRVVRLLCDNDRMLLITRY